MEYINNITTCRRNKNLNGFERSEIDMLNSFDYSPYSIAKKLKRLSNIIRNQLRRGTIFRIKVGKQTS